MMDRFQEEMLADCNSMVRHSADGAWLPARKDGKHFYALSGLMLYPPVEARDATPREIIDEMNASGQIPIKWPGIAEFSGAAY